MYRYRDSKKNLNSDLGQVLSLVTQIHPWELCFLTLDTSFS